MKIICENCGNEIKMKIYKRRLENKLTQIYIKCNRCSKEYHSYYENNISLKIQESIDKTRKQIQKQNNKILLLKLNLLIKRKRQILESINRKDDKK